MSRIFRQRLRTLLAVAALAPLIAFATASAAANHKSNIFVATGWPKGNWHFDIVVGDTPHTTLYMYTDDANSYKAKVNNQGWATFKNVDLTGALNQDADDGKLSFTRVVNGKQKPINYTRRYYATNNKVRFSVLFIHPTADITDITNSCETDTNTPNITATITNHSNHAMAYDIKIAVDNSSGKQVSTAESVMSLVANQYLPDQMITALTGTCGTSAHLASVNAYDSTNDNGQPNF